ncbi:hypothetical protein Salat_2862500 [Sesamum alatum]|uniref:Uncharacterized protein n=1 Tax=Sesamum alatum TaxID=300844 RepID=A0AAE1XMA2_9LAMI|nr:hypothetical protein Salat_2862500 [Sesamum alatum]
MDLARRIAILVALHVMMIEIVNVLFVFYCVHRFYHIRRKRSNTNKRLRTLEEEEEDRLLGVIANFCEATNKRPSDITNKMIGSEYDASQRRKKVYDAVCGAVPGLSVTERVLVARRKGY